MRPSYLRTKIMEPISHDLANGDKITWEYEAKALRCVWTNETNGAYWIVRASDISKIWFAHVNDPRLSIWTAFIYNKIDATEAIKMLDRLEKIKAFW